MQALAHTTVTTIPDIVNVMMVALLVFFVFAVIGVELFGLVKYGESYNMVANFRSWHFVSKTLEIDYQRP